MSKFKVTQTDGHRTTAKMVTGLNRRKSYIVLIYFSVNITAFITMFISFIFSNTNDPGGH